MASPLRPLLLVASHRDQLARVLLGAADVDEVRVPVQLLEHLLAAGTNRLIAALRLEARLGIVGDVGGRLPALRDPLLAGTVDQLDPVVAVVHEVPVGVGGEPVVAIAVEHHRVLVGDPPASHQPSEVLRAEEVPLHLVLEVLLPIEADRAGNVALGVQGGVLVDLDYPDRVVPQVLGNPVGLDQHVLRVVAHVWLLSGLDSSKSLSGFRLFDRRRPRRRGAATVGGGERTTVWLRFSRWRRNAIPRGASPRATRRRRRARKTTAPTTGPTTTRRRPRRRRRRAPRRRTLGANPRATARSPRTPTTRETRPVTAAAALATIPRSPRRRWAPTRCSSASRPRSG